MDKFAIETERKQVPETHQQTRNPTAVIVKGNPKYITGNERADKFYNDLAGFVRTLGYSVSFDPGEPYTSPAKADLWIGHSRGCDRLRFAPKSTSTVALGLPGNSNAINHPLDRFDPVTGPNIFHYMLTNEMKEAISKKKLEKKAEIDPRILGSLLGMGAGGTLGALSAPKGKKLSRGLLGGGLGGGLGYFGGYGVDQLMNTPIHQSSTSLTGGAKPVPEYIPSQPVQPATPPQLPSIPSSKVPIPQNINGLEDVTRRLPSGALSMNAFSDGLGKGVGSRNITGKDAVLNFHGGGVPGNYGLGYYQNSKNPYNAQFLQRRSEFNDVNPDKLSNYLKAVNPEKLVSPACNAEGGGCPEWYAGLAGDKLKEIDMTPPGYYGSAGVAIHPHFSNLIKNIIHQSPMHKYIKDNNGSWQDKGVDTDTQGGLLDAIPGAAPINAAIEPFEAHKDGGWGAHMDKVHNINNSPDLSYFNKVTAGLSRPLGMAQGLAEDTGGTAKTLYDVYKDKLFGHKRAEYKETEEVKPRNEGLSLLGRYLMKDPITLAKLSIKAYQDNASPHKQ